MANVADSVSSYFGIPRVGEIYSRIMLTTYHNVRYVSALEAVGIVNQMASVLNETVPAHKLCLFNPGKDEKKSIDFFTMIAAARLNFDFLAMESCVRKDEWPSAAALQRHGIEFVYFDDVGYSCTQIREKHGYFMNRCADCKAKYHVAVPFLPLTSAMVLGVKQVPVKFCTAPTRTTSARTRTTLSTPWCSTRRFHWPSALRARCL